MQDANYLAMDTGHHSPPASDSGHGFSVDLATLDHLACTAIKHEQLSSDEFLCCILDTQQVDILHSCLLVQILSISKKVLQEFQLEAILGPLNGHDVIISSATGSGKTLIMILLLCCAQVSMLFL